MSAFEKNAVQRVRRFLLLRPLHSWWSCHWSSVQLQLWASSSSLFASSEIIFIFWTVCQNNRLKHSERWDIDYNDDPDCCWRWRWCRVRLWWYGGSMGGDPLEVQVLLNPPQMSTENGSVVPNATPNHPPLETPLHADVHWWWWPSSYYWLACVHWWCPSC